jgi:alkylation response protein AidB-like acyl-CoA dehydrogenase
MDFKLTDRQEQIRSEVRALCQRFPCAYWRGLDAERRYPDEFVNAMTEAGWLAVLIPKEYGGGGLGMLEAGLILEEVNRSGGNAQPCHAQIYTMGALLHHAGEDHKRRYLPEIASGRLRLQAFAVTEPDAGTDTTHITTFAERRGDRYVVRGRKIFISRVQHSDLMLLLARTTPLDQVKKRSHGLSLFLVDLRAAGGRLEVKPIKTMVNNETNELIFDGLEVPAENRIGEEGLGLSYVLSGMNAERILIASECIGDGTFFIERATRRATERVVFGRPIGQNQGVQFPIAKVYMALHGARLMRDKAATLFDRREPSGEEANTAKYLASEAAWEAANVAMSTFGGYGMAVEYDIERKFRESRLHLVAPVANNLILSYVGQHVLGMPRSF